MEGTSDDEDIYDGIPLRSSTSVTFLRFGATASSSHENSAAPSQYSPSSISLRDTISIKDPKDRYWILTEDDETKLAQIQPLVLSFQIII
jgi:hypothetical protein